MNLLRLYRRVAALLAPERGLAITLVLANVALAAAGFLGPLMFGGIIDTLASSGERARSETWRQILLLLGAWGAVGVAGIAAGILVALHADRLAQRRRLAAMSQYFEHVLRLPHAFHNATHSGRQLKIMWQGADTLFGVWLSFLRENLATFVALFVLLPLTLLLNWRLSALLMLLIVVIAALTWFVFGRTHAAQARVEAYHSGLAELAGDALGNVVLVQSFVRLAAEARRLRAAMDELIAAQFPVLNWWALLIVLSGASSTITLITIFALGTWLHLHDRATVGEIVTFMGLATQLIGRTDQTISFINRLFFHAPRLAEFFAVLDTTSAIAEKPTAIAFGRVRGRVEFEGVSLTYGGDRPAVHDLAFVVEPGQTVALVGHTGAGKSTAVALLQRLRDPTAGTIRIDGVDLRDVTLDSLRANIGVVFQESMLFYRSIADNLRVGRPEASEAEVSAAARLAEAHEFILRQPAGYETLVGERGVTLSGGERQRLAIARALLKDPPILILDEATSALDAATEARIQQALRNVMQGRTTFVIAHRLSTVREADLILVFENGRIVERGSFSDLLAQGGVFAQLVATQLGPLQAQQTALAS
ncbi:MAG TPA: glucan ABC transporter ATP-binding protein/ permease [Geminicoccaceae bacterium]|nr:glucan ABC transporter ATP-binding protein/ permease [Geminicoccaceae bacterium]